MGAGADHPSTHVPGRRTLTGEFRESDAAASRVSPAVLELGSSALDEQRSHGLAEVISALGSMRGGRGLIDATRSAAMRATRSAIGSQTVRAAPMLYVHLAEAHMRPHPEPILRAQPGHDDPDQKIIAMLEARRSCWTGRGKTVAKPTDETEENREVLVS